MEKEIKRMMKLIEINKFKQDIISFYVTANELSNAHAGILFINTILFDLYRDNMLRDQERLTTHIYGYGQTDNQPPDAAHAAQDNADLVSVLSAETLVAGGGGGGSIASRNSNSTRRFLGEEDFEDEDLENVDLSDLNT